MKKKVVLLSIIGLVLFAGGIVMQFFLPQITNGIFGFNTSLMFDWATIQTALGNAFNFAAVGAYQIVFIAVLAVVGLLLLIHVVMLILKKHPLALLETLAWAIASAALLFAIVFLWTPEMFTSGSPLSDLTSTPDYRNAPFFIYHIAVFNGASDSLRVLYLILGFVPASLILAGFIVALAGLIVDFRYLGSLSAESKKEKKALDASGLDNVVVVHEDESPSAGDAAEDLGKDAPSGIRGDYRPADAEREYQGVRSAPAGQGGVGQSSINGPFLIQYINTYAPERQESAPAAPAKPAEQTPTEKEAEKAAPLSADDIRKIIRDEMAAEKKPERPLIIAVPSPAKKKEPEPIVAPAPEKKETLSADEIREIVASELKNAIGSNEDVVVEPEPQMPLTAEDIRQIIADEIKNSKKEEEPAPAPKVEEKKLSEDDVRDVIRQELLAFRDAEDAKEQKRREESERKAAEEAARAAEIEKAKKEAVAQALEQRSATVEDKPNVLSADDIRRIIAEEFAKQTPAVEESAPKVEEKAVDAFNPEEIRAMLREEIRAAQPVAEEKVAPVTVVVKQADPEPEPEIEAEPTLSAEDVRQIIRETIREQTVEKVEEKAVVEQPAAPAEPALTAEDVRNIIADAFAAQAAAKEPEPEPAPAEPSLTADDVRGIIAEALANFQPAPQAAPTTVVVSPTPVMVAPEAAPIEKVVAPFPAPAEEDDDQPNKIIRIPFPTRMVEADDEMRANYNELKSDILAYGVKSRVSNSGDTFRLHKVTFVKITIAGKSLKLYFALDPKDYKNTSLPIQDASHKNIYKDIPLVFKVKSELSLRRAKQLISDVMEKNGLEQGRVELRDHADSLKDYVAAGTKEADDED